MDVTFVGTGSADFHASLQCPCRNCLEARSLGGRNIRTFASLLLDDTLLVDCGETVPWRLAELDADPAAVSHLLVTHCHEDHLDTGALTALVAARGDRAPLHVYGNAAVMGWLRTHAIPVAVHELVPGDTVCCDGFEALALPARHDWGNQQSLNYVITRDGSSILYATDTAWPEPAWWELIATQRLAAAVVEATFGLLDATGHPDCLTHHLNWESLCDLASELRARGVLGTASTAWATHLSQHFVPIHDRFVVEVAAPGLNVAHDGLRLRI